MGVIIKMTPQQKAMAELIARQQKEREAKSREAEQKLNQNPYAQTKLTEYARQVAEMKARADKAEAELREQRERMGGGMYKAWSLLKSVLRNKHTGQQFQLM